MAQNELIYMHRALELARLGLGLVSPNPMVGCVIVHEGRIIGEGFHRQYGGPHAEVHAVNAVKDQHLLAQSTVYVTLEPCAHFGLTPPCAALLARHKVKKVVVATVDPNPLVAGKGLDMLRQAGIEVTLGTLAEEATSLNKRFFTAIQLGRPYIILKWAQTADGFIARPNFDSRWISNALSRKLVHKWRAEEDAILVGKNTARYDNPVLNVRDWAGKNPLRVVIDHHLRLDQDLHLFDGTIPTICYNLHKHLESDMLSYVQLDEASFLPQLLQHLHGRAVRSLMVEGGATTLADFIDAGLWDEARVFNAPACFGSGIRAPQLKQATFDGKEDIAGDTLTYFVKQ